MKLFKTAQIKQLDAYTIEHEPISSYDLMRRAVSNLFDKILPRLNRDQTISIFAGPGNNGGDALVLAKLFNLIGQPIEVFHFYNNRISADCQKAKEDAISAGIVIKENAENIKLECGTLIIDGLFGAGLSRPLTGIFKDIVTLINSSENEVWAIDIPSGLFGEDNKGNYTENAIIKANHTFTFQQPKIAFFMAENAPYVGDVHTIDIEILPAAINALESQYDFVEKNMINLKSRGKFSHKGTFGHGLLIAGKYGMAGAAVLATRSALRMGIGLITTHIPSQLYTILQISVPEAIIDLDKNSDVFSHILIKNTYNAIGIGPGLGTNEISYHALEEFLEGNVTQPIVLDADALNIISQHKELLNLIPHNTIITPHPKEFDRIAGQSSTAYDRLQKGIDIAQKYQIIVIIKGANTSIILPDGHVFFNSTGNAGMATAGSGDVLTGIILSLLAQRYTAAEAAIYGVYLHGLAGDIAAENLTEESVTASDIINYLPQAIKQTKRYK